LRNALKHLDTFGQFTTFHSNLIQEFKEICIYIEPARVGGISQIQKLLVRRGDCPRSFIVEKRKTTVAIETSLDHDSKV
jgi:hypothetical protein